jgi:DNA polymerase III subunit beta
MHISVDKSLLCDAVKRLIRITDDKASLQAGSLYIEPGNDTLTISTTNNELYARMSVPATCKKSDPFMLPGGLTFGIISGMPERILITDDQEGKTVKVTSGKSKAIIRTVVGHHPSLNVAPVEQEITVDMSMLSEALQRVGIACSENPNEVVKNCISIEQQDGVLYVDATDGYRIASSTVNNTSLGTEDRQVLLPSAFVKEILRYVGDGATIGIGLGEKLCTVYLKDYTLSTRLVDAPYPKVRSRLKTDGLNRLVINTEALITSLKRCRSVKTNTIRFKITDGRLDLIAVSEYGEAHEIVDAAASVPVTFSINADYATDALTQVTALQTTIYYSDDRNPIVIKDMNYSHAVAVFTPR